MENGWKNKRPGAPETSTYCPGANRGSEPEDCAEYQARKNAPGTGHGSSGGKEHMITGSDIEDGEDKNPPLAEEDPRCREENLNDHAEQEGRSLDVPQPHTTQKPVPRGSISYSFKPLAPHIEELDVGGDEVPLGVQPSTAAGAVAASEMVNGPGACAPAVDNAEAVDNVKAVEASAKVALSPIEEYEGVRMHIARQLEEASLGPNTRGQVTVRPPDETIEINFYIPALRSPISVSEEDSDRTACSNHTDEGDSELTHSGNDSAATSDLDMQGRYRYDGIENTQIVDYRAANLEDTPNFTGATPGSEEEREKMYSDSEAEARDDYANGEQRQDGTARQTGAGAFVHMEAEGLSDAAEETVEEDTELKEFVDQECRDGDDNAMGAFAADIEESEDRNLLRLRKRFAPNRPARLSAQSSGGHVSVEAACRELDSLSQEDSAADDSSGSMELIPRMPDNVPLPGHCEGEAQSVSALKAGEQIGPVDGAQQFANNAEALARAEKRPEAKRFGFKEL